jgi:hypothetical protein
MEKEQLILATAGVCSISLGFTLWFTPSLEPIYAVRVAESLISCVAGMLTLYICGSF